MSCLAAICVVHRVELAQQVGDLGVRPAIAAWLASMAAWAFLADHVHFDGVRGVLGIHLHDDAFCRMLGQQCCLHPAVDEGPGRATLRIGGNGDAAAPALRGATGRRTAA